MSVAGFGNDMRHRDAETQRGKQKNLLFSVSLCLCVDIPDSSDGHGAGKKRAASRWDAARFLLYVLRVLPAFSPPAEAEALPTCVCEAGAGRRQGPVPINTIGTSAQAFRLRFSRKGTPTAINISVAGSGMTVS